MKNLIKNFAIFFLVFVMIAVFFSFQGDGFSQPERVGINKFIEHVNNENVEKVVVEGAEMEVTLKDGAEIQVKKESGETLSELLSNYDVSKERILGINVQVKENEGLDYWLVTVLPFLLPFLLIAGFIYFMMRSAQGANSRAMMFGQSQAKEVPRDRKDKVTFKDVAGSVEAKEELMEVVEFLKQPKKFKDIGARIPKGVLLLGSPGTGKTLMARAVSGEANVPFFHISGSEFVEMFVGVGASRVRDLFKKAKKNTPCIVFIDEIDAVGRKRGAGLGGSHDEREQTLNQILVEMDGFDPNTNIIVMAATNRPDVLDPALLRPGRFDRQVMIDNPDIKEREEILKVHARKKPLAKEVNLRRVAERTPGFSGADLQNVINEASILAARSDKKIVDMEDMFEAIEKVMLGPERKSRVLSEREKRITAYHEAGHAIVAHLLPNTDMVHKISIISRGRAGGYTLKLPSEDRYLHTKTEHLEDLAVLLAGYVTEKDMLNEITTGASSDLRRATQLARSLVTDYGMSDSLGPRTYGEKEDMIFLGKEIHEQKDYSEKSAEVIDEEINKLIRRATEQAREIVKDNGDILEKVVKALLEKETLEKNEFEEIVGRKTDSEEDKQKAAADTEGGKTDGSGQN